MRRIANKLWDVSRYASLLKGVLDKDPGGGTLETRFGPWITTSSNVTPAALLRALPLVNGLLDAGQVEAVIHSARFEAATFSCLQENPALCCRGKSSQTQAYEATNHVMAVLKFLRTWKYESDNASNSRWKRLFPKTNFMRRRLSPTESYMVQETVSKISGASGSPAGSPSPSAKASGPAGSPSPSSKASEPAISELQEKAKPAKLSPPEPDFPPEFAPSPKRMDKDVDVDKDALPPSQASSADSWPLCFAPTKETSVPEPNQGKRGKMIKNRKKHLKTTHKIMPMKKRQ